MVLIPSFICLSNSDQKPFDVCPLAHGESLLAFGFLIVIGKHRKLSAGMCLRQDSCLNMFKLDMLWNVSE